MRLILTLCCLLGLLWGCDGDDPVTELRVVVHSDLAVPDALAAVHARVTRDGGPAREHTFALHGDDAVTLPLSFSIVPRNTDASGTVELVVEGRSLEGRTEIARSARTRFIAGTRLSLPILLLRDCVGIVCADAETCNAGVCIDGAIDPGELSEITAGEDPQPGLPPRPDAGPPPMDDAGPMADASLPMDATADPPTDGGDGDGDGDGNGDGGANAAVVVACGADPCQCTAPRCDLHCNADGCDALCSDAECSANLIAREDAALTCNQDAVCQVHARDGKRITIECAQGARCDVDCSDAQSCHLNCPGGDCLLRCEGASNCRLDACPQEVQSCDGSVEACGHACPP